MGGPPLGLGCDVRLTTTAAPADGDGDGVPNGSDSCPTAVNADQTDTQGDGQLDACGGPEPSYSA